VAFFGAALATFLEAAFFGAAFFTTAFLATFFTTAFFATGFFAAAFFAAGFAFFAFTCVSLDRCKMAWILGLQYTYVPLQLRRVIALDFAHRQ